ncbi:hypothetical protein [Maribacter sp. 2307ULW6-5]|uniref:hypothetical protein n=1 Tax=Maribacter sp. 2307ULW6-5 TaxID=3386275 RepID=UPI0039BD87CD
MLFLLLERIAIGRQHRKDKKSKGAVPNGMHQEPIFAVVPHLEQMARPGAVHWPKTWPFGFLFKNYMVIWVGFAGHRCPYGHPNVHIHSLLLGAYLPKFLVVYPANLSILARVSALSETKRCSLGGGLFKRGIAMGTWTKASQLGVS